MQRNLETPNFAPALQFAPAEALACLAAAVHEVRTNQSTSHAENYLNQRIAQKKVVIYFEMHFQISFVYFKEPSASC